MQQKFFAVFVAILLPMQTLVNMEITQINCGSTEVNNNLSFSHIQLGQPVVE